jgi:hypothetical protein
MHENEKSEDSGDIVAAIIAVILIIIPIAALVGYFYFKTELDGYLSRLTNTLKDFWLSEYEKERYITIKNKIAAEEAFFKESISKATQSGLIINIDGTFSNMEKVSEDLIDELSLQFNNLKNLQSTLDYLTNSPVIQWESFNAIVRKVTSLKAALIGWLVLFIIYLITKQDFWGAYISASAISILVFFVFYGIFSKEGEKFSPRPPMVSLDNLNFDKQTANPEIAPTEDDLYYRHLMDKEPDDGRNV